jgi:hypothetical protein
VIHEAAAPSLQPVRDRVVLDRVRERYDPPERFASMSGRSKRRTAKADRRICQLAEERPASHQLVCAGPYGWLSRDIEDLIARLQIEDAVRFTG